MLDPSLAEIHKLSPAQLVGFYSVAVRQLQDSLRDDAQKGRWAAYMASLRISMECYMKGLWVGLIATPSQVVHDASGEHSVLLLEKLQRIIFTQVLKTDPNKLRTISLPTGKNLNANDVLNLLAHSTANFVFAACLPSCEKLIRENLIPSIDVVITKQVKTLQEVSMMFSAGHSRRRIIAVMGERFQGQP